MADASKATSAVTLETAYLAGGCFWCLEPVYDELQGVADVQSGYMGGHVPNPTYEQVCTGLTGHAETVRVRFDPEVVSYRDLLDVFFTIHDPTTLNRQGADVGPQYRSAIFCADGSQENTARDVVDELTRAHAFSAPIVTEVVPAGPFYQAESIHDEYFLRNPGSGYCQFVIAPKVAKFRRRFAERLKRDG